MKPTFALNLSHDGIGLLRREGGAWASLGEVALDDPNLNGALDTLRRRAEAAAPQGVRSKLIIPASQILYTEVEAPGPGTAQRRRQIAAALEGMTPYPVEDLVFDWSGHGEVVQVAVVARETLTEAETFAETYGFNPLSFVAIPAPGQFAGEPWFGPTRGAATILPEGGRIERDQDPVRLVQPVAVRMAPEAPVETPAETPEPVEVPPAVADDAAPAEALPQADASAEIAEPAMIEAAQAQAPALPEAVAPSAPASLEIPAGLLAPRLSEDLLAAAADAAPAEAAPQPSDAQGASED
ncbi:MAG: translation initiation factor 2, partial [Sphingomonadales bacterium]|nr:translation initiation factor 2 [Sphingomonadales bacterium]